ncbi:MAG: 6,7-dimethyl-8-ribityllumazine synthase [Bacteroidia bacterium]|nr:6,7-dimethyl-8-ribityllumazine synthase [Bacteroidia bacterium]
MSSAAKNLSEFSFEKNPAFKKMKVGIAVAEWNTAITSSLLNGAVKFLKDSGVKPDNIFVHHVPGSFELTLGAQWLAEQKKYDAVIALGCVIQGETKHFDFICAAVANGITEVGLKYNKPVIFGVLTTNTLQQAKDRSGGKHGNKGTEAAATALKMALLQRTL